MDNLQIMFTFSLVKTKREGSSKTLWPSCLVILFGDLLSGIINPSIYLYQVELQAPLAPTVFN